MSSTSIERSGTGVPEPPSDATLDLDAHLWRRCRRWRASRDPSEIETEHILVEAFAAATSGVAILATMRLTFMPASPEENA